ncbi:Protein abil2 [Sarracenia purpurea var. burkii]
MTVHRNSLSKEFTKSISNPRVAKADTLLLKVDRVVFADELGEDGEESPPRRFSGVREDPRAGGAVAFTPGEKEKIETMISSVSLPISPEPANYDEVSMHQSLLFSDSLKDLKNLRTQLYSAAEYFELSYTNDDQKQIVVDTLKDYAIKALVNTVDHLGSVTYKVNDLLDEKVDEVSGTELRVSCIEQRLRTCQEYIDREGLSEQSLVINTPKYHKRYILPVGETMRGASHTKSKCQGCSLDDEDEWPQFRNAVRAMIRETPSSSFRKELSQSPSPRPLQQAGTFLFAGSTPKRELDKRSVSPHRFPLLRSGSLSSRPTTPNSRSTTPNPSRPTTPNASVGRSGYPSEPRKSASMRLRPEKEKEKENLRESEQYPSSKSKRLLKALLSRRKSKKDELLYTYLDEY